MSNGLAYLCQEANRGPRALLVSPFSRRAEARQQARQAETPASSRAQAATMSACLYTQVGSQPSLFRAVPLRTRRHAAVLVYQDGGAGLGFPGPRAPWSLGPVILAPVVF